MERRKYFSENWFEFATFERSPTPAMIAEQTNYPERGRNGEGIRNGEGRKPFSCNTQSDIFSSKQQARAIVNSLIQLKLSDF